LRTDRLSSTRSKETIVNTKNAPRRALKYTATLGAAAFVAALALTACGAPSAQPASPPATHVVSADKPTIVLVHGGFTDASEWDAEIKSLQSAGYPVVAPPNPLRGMASDSQYLHSFLLSVKGPIILVGHSIGGFVTTQAAVGDPQVIPEGAGSVKTPGCSFLVLLRRGVGAPK